MNPATAGKPHPSIDEENKPYFEAAQRRELRLQRCNACRSWVFYPRAACPSCLNMALTWELASGRGELISYAVVHRPHHPAFYNEVPILFGAIKLEEGPTMLSELRAEDESELRLGMLMQVRFEALDADLILPVWEAAS